MSRSLYRAPLPQFLLDARRSDFADDLARRAREDEGRETGDSERRSWKVSLPARANVLSGSEFSGGTVFVELLMPLCSRRCDVLLTGIDDRERPTCVLVELKQWTRVKPSHLAGHVLLGNQVHLHPSEQIQGYVEQLRHYHSAFTQAPSDPPILLEGCVFLHDMENQASLALLRNEPFLAVARRYPTFGARDVDTFRHWLASRLTHGKGDATAERIAAGRSRPSERLLDVLIEFVKGEFEYHLLDEQRTAFLTITSAVQLARDSGTSTVVVVRGGPGTGKSVLAIQLLAYAARQRWTIAHGTGSKAFSTVLKGRTLEFVREMLKRIFGARTKREIPVDDLFTTFADLARLGARDPGCLDLAVCDEAHRLWKHRRIVYPNGKVRWLTETDMAEEVISCAKVVAFFIDDLQAVRSGEIGRSDLLVAAAKRLGYRVETVDLSLQFRCAGSDGWVRWVDGLLGFGSPVSALWRTDGEYDLAEFARPADLERWIRSRAAGGEKCRLVAGFCWRWSKPDALGNLPHDIRIGDWTAPWIEKTGKDLKPLDNQYFKWATDETRIGQVGSIYSVQGFEFDRVGVIWSEDLVWRQDRWVAQLEKSKDGAFKKELAASGEDPVEKLRNVYRVLLTRGMRSCGLHVVDPETRAHVESMATAPSQKVRRPA